MTTNIELDLVRSMADQLGCFIEEDFQQLAGVTPLTVEAWRKRDSGPAYIRLGTRYLYPKKEMAEFIEKRIKRPTFKFKTI